jgi:hypothetical protein
MLKCHFARPVNSLADKETKKILCTKKVTSKTGLSSKDIITVAVQFSVKHGVHGIGEPNER